MDECGVEMKRTPIEKLPPHTGAAIEEIERIAVDHLNRQQLSQRGGVEPLSGITNPRLAIQAAFNPKRFELTVGQPLDQAKTTACDCPSWSRWRN